jgi:hypothetical protein
LHPNQQLSNALLTRDEARRTVAKMLSVHAAAVLHRSLADSSFIGLL